MSRGPLVSGLFDVWLPPSPRLRRDRSFRLSHRVFKPAPSPKPRQTPKSLAAHRYIFSVNALSAGLARVAIVLFTLTVAKAADSPRPFLHPDRIRYDSHCLTIDGKDVLIYSGAFHYFRCPK